MILKRYTFSKENLHKSSPWKAWQLAAVGGNTDVIFKMNSKSYILICKLKYNISAATLKKKKKIDVSI